MTTPLDVLTIAVQHHQVGHLDTAANLYQQVLQQNPEQPDALHLLGVIAHQRGDHPRAVELILRSLRFSNNNAVAHNNLGAAYLALDQPATAAECFRRSLALQPASVEAHRNLGTALKSLGSEKAALESYQRALALNPHDAESLDRLADAFYVLGQLEEAVACYRRALAADPARQSTLNSLGNALRLQGDISAAADMYRRALAVQPDSAAAHSNLGLMLMLLGDTRESLMHHRRAIELDAKVAEFHNSLGLTLKELDRLDDAAACYRRALELKPEYPQPWINLGVTLTNQALGEAGVACFQRALELAPQNLTAHSGLLFTRIFCPGDDPLVVREEQREWQRRHGASLAAAILPHLNDRSPDRRLRIGYVSPYFREHCQSLFTVPLLSSHDHDHFEIYCYSDVERADTITSRLRSCADVWRETSRLHHEHLAQLIRDDRIDILVDLTMHLAQNRLPVFARKPAPVQVCWLAYPGSTGLEAMDYRLTDPYLDPPGLNDHLYSEKSVHLPDAFWCYDPLEGTTEVQAPPALRTGWITFGCLNNFCKVNTNVLQLWARVLQQVQNSRILILVGEGSHRDRALATLVAAGVAPHRVTFVKRRPRNEYLQYYHDIDIALDTVPSNGHTTSLDALWMGVPVVTLVGETVSGRAGLCQLTNLGLPEFIAATPDDYVRIAAGLAGDPARLAELRQALRPRLRASPLMDAPRFAKNVEEAYRRMWHVECGA